MEKSLYILTAIAGLALAAPSFAADKETMSSETSVKGDSNGNYESKKSAEQNDANGTTTKEDSKVQVKTDSNGDTKKTVESESSTDPKGLMNKSTEKTKDTVETKKGKKIVHHKKKVNGTVTEDTSTTKQQ